MRLEVQMRLPKKRILNEFQFQTGAIRSIKGESNTTRLERFNSKLVRLEGETFAKNFDNFISFNSKLVRLEGNSQIFLVDCSPKFQFQTGAIRRVSFQLSCHYSYKFQFQTGAIRRRIFSFSRILSRAVSIPNWCD